MPQDTIWTDAMIEDLADHPEPFWRRFEVTEDDLDGFQHVNNAVYLKWMDATIWDHTRHVGLDEHTCMKLNRGMAAVRHDIRYLSSVFLGDQIVVYNWICDNDQRLRASRLIQVVRLNDQKTILRAQSDYVCTNLQTGRPARMPEEFKERYPIKAPGAGLDR